MGTLASPRDPASIRMKLHALHGQLASTTDPMALGLLLRRYIAATDELYLSMKNPGGGGLRAAQGAQVVGGLVPGGAIISAAITGSGNLHSSAGS